MLSSFCWPHGYFSCSTPQTNYCPSESQPYELSVWGYIFAAFSIVEQGIYQALGNGVYSLIVTLLRVAILLLPILYVFVNFFEAYQIWWAFIFSEGGSSIVAAFLLKRIYSQKVIPLKS
jgi:Na+-driven multidrug efflux pump